jgi:hypothetical protein
MIGVPPVKALSVLSREGLVHPETLSTRRRTMEKRKLRLEELVVESFETAASKELRGTVQGNEYSEACYTDEFPSCPRSCEPRTCDEGCSASCGGTCYACATNTCYGYYTCAGVNTCEFVDTCIFPQCTAPGAAC